MPTSFIPKRPVSTDAVSAPKKSRSVGILSLLATIVVIATVVSFAGVYLYQRQLDSQKINTQKEVEDAKDDIGSDFLTDMKELNARIEGVKDLINTHIVVSPIFSALEETTLRSIQYKTFKYDFVIDPVSKAKMVEVSLTGVAKSYETIALQSDAFIKAPLIKNPVFSGLTVDEKVGTIDFILMFNVLPEDLSFQKFVSGLEQATVVTPTTI